MCNGTAVIYGKDDKYSLVISDETMQVLLLGSFLIMQSIKHEPFWDHMKVQSDVPTLWVWNDLQNQLNGFSFNEESTAKTFCTVADSVITMLEIDPQSTQVDVNEGSQLEELIPTLYNALTNHRYTLSEQDLDDNEFTDHSNLLQEFTAAVERVINTSITNPVLLEQISQKISFNLGLKLFGMKEKSKKSNTIEELIEIQRNALLDGLVELPTTLVSELSITEYYNLVRKLLPNEDTIFVECNMLDLKGQLCYVYRNNFLCCNGSIILNLVLLYFSLVYQLTVLVTKQEH